MTETKRTFCRICVASCGLEVDVEGGRVVEVRGDREHAMSRGFSCVKGRRMTSQLYHPERLTGTLRRRDDGTFAAVETEGALDEIAERLTAIRAEHGAHAIATYAGTAAYAAAPAIPVLRAWHAALGSRSLFTSLTIDQASKILAVQSSGVWAGGPHGFDSADVVMLVGNNPFISGLHQMGGPPGWRPMALREAKERGLKLICIDPRRTEVAKLADLHLPIRPGEDATMLAAMLRVVLTEKLYDREFCDAHVDGLDALCEAVEPFTLDYAAARTGVDGSAIDEAVRLFAAGPRGTASSGTGPDMGPFPHLSERLLFALNTVLGRWNREGERVTAPSALGAPMPRPAQGIAPELLPPQLNDAANAERSRIGGARQVYGEMPTGVLAREILTPGEDRIRALIVVGGNPMAAWPDQATTQRALEDLDLLVCVDIVPTETTRHADYVVGARHALERDDLSAYQDMLWEEPFAQVSRAVVDGAPGLLEEWQVISGLARRMGLELQLAGGAVAPGDETLDVLERVYPDAKIPVRRIAEYEGGHIFDELDERVAPPIEGLEWRLPVALPETTGELAAVREQSESEPEEYPLRLACRRLADVANSVGRDFAHAGAGGSANPARLSPADLARLGLEVGDRVRLESAHGAVEVLVGVDADLREGVVSMAHCFGGPDTQADASEVGGAVSRLLSVLGPAADPVIAMPQFTGIPVRVSRIADSSTRLR